MYCLQIGLQIGLRSPCAHTWQYYTLLPEQDGGETSTPEFREFSSHDSLHLITAVSVFLSFNPPSQSRNPPLPFRGNFHLEFSPEKIPGGNCREMAEWKMKQPSEGWKLQMERLSTAMVKQRELAAGEPAHEFSRRCLPGITSQHHRDHFLVDHARCPFAPVVVGLEIFLRTPLDRSTTSQINFVALVRSHSERHHHTNYTDQIPSLMRFLTHARMHTRVHSHNHTQRHTTATLTTHQTESKFT